MIILYQCKPEEKHISGPEEIQSLEQQLQILESEARMLPDQGAQEQLVTIYYKAKLVMKQIPDSSSKKAKATLFFANKLNMNGGYNEAVKQAWKAIDISHTAQIDDPVEYRIQVFGTLAGLYNRIGKPDSAFIIYKLAVSDAAYHPDPVRMASPLNNAGLSFYARGQLDSAMLYFQLADSLVNSVEDYDRSWQQFQGSIRGNLASIFFDKREYAKAKALYIENYLLYEKIENESRLINAGISIAKTEIELGDYRSADHYLELSQKRLASLDSPAKNDIWLNLLSVKEKYYERIQDIAGALAILKQITSLTDSMNRANENNQLLTSGLLARYSSAMFETALQNEKMLLEAEKQRARMRFWIILLVAAGITITPTILLFYYRQNARLHKQRNKLIETDQLLTQQKLILEQKEKLLVDLELENKKKDLTEIALHLSKKQEWASELNQRIKLIESLKGNKRLTEFNALKNEIRNQLHVDKEKAVIINNIDNLNAAFYERITERFPSLTPAEMKLFSLIKLKMSNAQIAQLQNINPDSVRTSRMRLRKKLNLGPDQDLDTFIQSF